MVYLAGRVARFGEPGATLARTQDKGALGKCVEDEDTASGVIWPLKRQPTCQVGHRDP